MINHHIDFEEKTQTYLQEYQQVYHLSDVEHLQKIEMYHHLEYLML